MKCPVATVPANRANTEVVTCMLVPAMCAGHTQNVRKSALSG